jgi:hypothetical protein
MKRNKSIYGQSRLPTGTVTQIVVNPQQALPIIYSGGEAETGVGTGNSTGTGGVFGVVIGEAIETGTGTGTNTAQPPAYFINGATEAFKKLLSKNITKLQINMFLENYRQMIALQTNTVYVPTVLDASVTGVTSKQANGKVELTTVDGANAPTGIIL